jgi:hypothetical protein
MSEPREEKMTLEQAKKTFINPYWADCSGNIQPLCLCFQPGNATKYEKEKIPFASNIVRGTDPSGNDCKVILCTRCFDFNVEYQKKLEGGETMTNGIGGLYIPVDKDLISTDINDKDGEDKDEDGDNRVQGGDITPSVENEEGGEIYEKRDENVEEDRSREEIQI